MGCAGRVCAGDSARAHREVWPQNLADVRRSRFQFFGQRRFPRASVAPWGKAPAEHGSARRHQSLADRGSAASPASTCRSSTQACRRRCPSASRRLSIAPALTSAGADSTSPVGRTKPSHSKWAVMLGSRAGMVDFRREPLAYRIARLRGLVLNRPPQPRRARQRNLSERRRTGERDVPMSMHKTSQSHRQGVLRHLQDLGPFVPASVGSQHIGEGNKEPTAFLWRKHTRINLASRLVESSRELPGVDAVQCRPMALKSISMAGSEPPLVSLMKPSSAKRVNSRWKVRSVTLA